MAGASVHAHKGLSYSGSFLLAGQIKDGDAVSVSFDGNDFVFNGRALAG